MTSTTTQTRIKGRVDWYSPKFSYGFVKYTDEKGETQDLFVHKNDLVVHDEEITQVYLVPGEWVEFTLADCDPESIDKDNSDKTETQSKTHTTGNRIKAGDVTSLDRLPLQMEVFNTLKKKNAITFTFGNAFMSAINKIKGTGKGQGIDGKGKGNGKGKGEWVPHYAR
jgi:cold shock CspA family protein